MIIGKSLTAGGGGLTPELVVKSNSGAVIDVMQNGVIRQTYTLGAEETSHTFDIGQGTYTVRVTNGGTERTQVVTVDTEAQYVVKLPSPRYLITNGTRNVSWWQDNNYRPSPAWISLGYMNLSIYPQNDYLRVSHSYFTDSGTRSATIISDNMDISMYNCAKVDFSGHSETSNYAWCALMTWSNGAAQANTSYWNQVLDTGWDKSKYQDRGRGTTTIPFGANEVGTRRLGFGFATNQTTVSPTSWQYINIYNVWLE